MNMKYKSGNMLIFVFTFLIIIILLVCIFAISVLYIQIDIKLKGIKMDLPNIIKNVALQNCDKELLKNDIYKFNLDNMKYNVNDILGKNYSNVKVYNISYNDNSNNFEILLKINIRPLIVIKNYKEITISLYQECKFKTMEVTDSNF